MTAKMREELRRSLPAPTSAGQPVYVVGLCQGCAAILTSPVWTRKRETYPPFASSSRLDRWYGSGAADRQPEIAT